jgi:predicted porin
MKLRITGAAAFLAFAASAHAQSSVTLYGAVDAGLLWQTTNVSTFVPSATRNPNQGSAVSLKDGGIAGSMFGLRGTEDLGDGYKANFRLQGAFSINNGKSGLADAPGAGSVFTQVTTVGLQGPFGKIDFGRQFAPMAYAMAATDVRNAQYFGSILTAWLTMNTVAGWPGNSTNGPIGALYDDNAIVYNSPSLYGFSVALEYAPGGVPGQLQGGTRESAVLNYSNFGLNATAVYYNGHDSNPFQYPNVTTAVPATGLNNNRFVYFGAKYTWHGLSVSGSFSNGRNPANTNTGAPGGASGNIDMWTAGLGYRFTPAFDITSGVYYLKDQKHNQNQSTLYVLGANYALSKATVTYAQIGFVSNRGAMNQEIEYAAPVAPGRNTTAAMVGLRHTF